MVAWSTGSSTRVSRLPWYLIAAHQLPRFSMQLYLGKQHPACILRHLCVFCVLWQCWCMFSQAYSPNRCLPTPVNWLVQIIYIFLQQLSCPMYSSSTVVSVAHEFLFNETCRCDYARRVKLRIGTMAPKCNTIFLSEK